MSEKQLVGNGSKEQGKTIRKQPDSKIIQAITLVVLPFIWIGYAIALYNGNSNSLSSYSLLILVFSLINQDVFFKGESVSNKFLNNLAKAESVLFCVWVLLTIVQLIMK